MNDSNSSTSVQWNTEADSNMSDFQPLETDLNSSSSPSWNSHPHWVGFGAPTVGTNLTIAIVLTVIGVLGVVGNTIVLIVFTRFKRLQGPFSAFIINLAAADLATSLLHGMVTASSYHGVWIFGELGCQIYAFGVGLCGLNSIVTLAAIAVERYIVITSKPLPASWKVTQSGAHTVILTIWFYCLCLTLPPFFGWSRYVQEGFFSSCTWDYISRDMWNRIFYLYLLIFGFFLPVGVIFFCYFFIIQSIIAHDREMRDIATSCGGGPVAYVRRYSRGALVTRRVESSRVNNPYRSAYIMLMLILLFLLSWTPYAIVTLIAQFGDVSYITPWVATLPAIFAKTSVIYNPIVYGLSHPHFRSTVKEYIDNYRHPRPAVVVQATRPARGDRSNFQTFDIQEYGPRPNRTNQGPTKYRPPRSEEIPPTRCPTRLDSQQAYHSEPANQHTVVVDVEVQPCDTTVHWETETAHGNAAHVRRSKSEPHLGDVRVDSSNQAPAARALSVEIPPMRSHTRLDSQQVYHSAPANQQTVVVDVEVQPCDTTVHWETETARGNAGHVRRSKSEPHLGDVRVDSSNQAPAARALSVEIPPMRSHTRLDSQQVYHSAPANQHTVVVDVEVQPCDTTVHWETETAHGNAGHVRPSKSEPNLGDVRVDSTNQAPAARALSVEIPPMRSHTRLDSQQVYHSAPAKVQPCDTTVTFKQGRGWVRTSQPETLV